MLQDNNKFNKNISLPRRLYFVAKAKLKNLNISVRRNIQVFL